MTPETLQFIRTHRTDDIRLLALQAARYPEVEMETALTQIAGWQTARHKLPSWAACPDILYPPHLSMEQCSSEATARYKADVVKAQGEARHSLTDLTGGFGIDCSFLSACFEEVTYVERQAVLCEAAVHNFQLLGLLHIQVCHTDAIRHLQAMTPCDWIFIDPARRNEQGGKTVAMADCEPDVAQLESLLCSKGKRVLVKLSPMLDLSQALHTLKHVEEAHIVASDGECKELLLMLNGCVTQPADDVPICCIDLPRLLPDNLSLVSSRLLPFRFTRRTEREAACPYADVPRQYLYEPHAALLKAGAFRSLTQRYKVAKLHPSSHLYTSDTLIADFPGRRFRILRCQGFSKKEVKALQASVSRANLTVRNFPATVAELRRKLKLAEGGDLHLFATTLNDNSKTLILCQKT